jgi:methylamine dehydrogenase accessory protein MauD
LDIALLVARLILATVFVVAGLAKLADRVGSRQAIVGFGVPERIATASSLLLPVAELAVAVALIPEATAWWGAVGAGALLLLFIAAIGINLARGRKPDCRCFGQLSSSPVGWTTLARNALLTAVAGFMVWQGRDDPGRSAISWASDLSPGGIAVLVGGLALLCLVAVEGFVLLNVLRQNGRLMVRLETIEERLTAAGIVPAPIEEPPPPEHGLPVGSPAPTFQLSGLYGETLTLEALRAAGKPVLLVLTDPHCGPCNALMPEIGSWQRDHAAALTVALISRGSPDENHAKSSEHGLANVLLQQDHEVAEAYQEEGTPSAVLVRPDGTIGSSLAAGAEAIRALVARTVGAPGGAPAPSASPAPLGSPSGNGAAAPEAPPAARIGEPTPPLKLRDLDGHTVNLTGFRGAKTLVVFWNPQCGFCQRMVDDLKAWEADRPEGAPKLVIVSTGAVEENRAMGLRSPVLLDEGFGVASSFGANGTPMAVLVDEEGKIASELAAGAPAVMALARGESADHEAPRTASATVGELAPPVRVPDLTGKTVDLADFRGSKTLVLFWNPGCGFCQQMLDDLQAWDANPPEGAPNLLVVTNGDGESARAMNLRSPVLLDDGSTGAAFGANGTPMAVLVDEDDRIASGVAAGAPAVLELARGGQPAPSS